jgi:tRNA 5-methylaminomethyl-2-thiouridine biosynthesis bifunctional protein
MSELVPAELAFAGDGTPFSPRYGDVYHSAQGAVEQAQHVFIGGNDLPARWTGDGHFTILETGFGLGLNFLATWQAWNDAGQPCQLHFVSIEKHPFHAGDLRQLLARHPALETLATLLLAQWPPLIGGFHRLHFANNRINLTLLFGDAAKMLPKLVASVDAVFLDGFSPAKNPELWSPALLAQITRRCTPDATLATWSVAGELRRALESFGWHVGRRPGFATKREMIVARRRVHSTPVHPEPVEGQAGAAPMLRQAQHELELGGTSGQNRLTAAPASGHFISPSPTFCAGKNPHHAIVIGAGIAGCAVSERLAARGWCIELIDRQPVPAQEASGNPAGVVLPRIAKDDALAARFSRACYLYALRRLQRLPGARWGDCGVFQIAKDVAHESLQRDAITRHPFPVAYVEFLERDTAAERLGHPVAHGGWWFPAAGWVDPSSVCRALLETAGQNITPHFKQEIARLEYADKRWHALDSTGKLIASAAHVVLANAAAANRLLSVPLPLISVRGQVSFLPPAHHPSLAAVKTVLCRSSYLTPPAAGTVCFGASFDPKDPDPALRLVDHQENLDRLDELLPGCTAGIVADSLNGRVGFRTATPDHLPLVGTLAALTAATRKDVRLDTLPRAAGLHVLVGLGARGIVWAPLVAELLAAQLNGEPLPLEQELVAAIDPARAELKAFRQGSRP